MADAATIGATHTMPGAASIGPRDRRKSSVQASQRHRGRGSAPRSPVAIRAAGSGSLSVPARSLEHNEPVIHLDQFGGSSFALPIGPRVRRGAVEGYPIDFREKTLTPDWPPPFLAAGGAHRYLLLAQWGLGAFERELAAEPGRWLEAAVSAGEHLLATQVPEGRGAGCWLEPVPNDNTFLTGPSWPSAMAQGECASLLARLHLRTGREDFARAARLALHSFDVSVAEGGVRALLDGGAFPEEYPTKPPSYVLNGAIFAIWGLRDVSVGLGDETAAQRYAAYVDTLVRNLPRWDLGYWSRYDLHRHPGPVNIASFNYHWLHIRQLQAFAILDPRPEFGQTARRFEAYAASRARRAHAYARKVAFRLLVPRSRVWGERLPWTASVYRSTPPGAGPGAAGGGRS
jgi:heparosan-N-sulfate-glucuronate 5-epimerase